MTHSESNWGKAEQRAGRTALRISYLFPVPLGSRIAPLDERDTGVRILNVVVAVGLSAGSMGWAESVPCSKAATPIISEAQARAQLDLTNKDYKAVEKDLKPLVADHPEACQLALLLGRAYLYSKDDRMAALQFRNVLTRDPTNRMAKLEMARLYGYQSKYKESTLLYKELLSADATDEQASIGLARNLIRTQRLAEAKTIVDAGLAAHPNSLRLQEYKDALARPQTGMNGVDTTPPRPADVQTWIYYVTDSAGDRVIENLSRLNLSLSRLLTAQVGANYRYLSSVGTIIQAPDGNTENAGGDSSISATTFDGSARLSYRVKPWLTLSGGGGGITYNDGVSRALFQSGVDFHPTRTLYFNTEYLRTPVLPTQQAATFNLTSQGLRNTLDWYPRQWRIHAAVSEFKYSDGNLRNAQNAEIIRWFGSGKIRFGAGYNGSHVTSSHVLLHGYFSPDTYQNHTGTGVVQIRSGHAFTGE
jgi:tetratricopeptide (TPR) repeat protein